MKRLITACLFSLIFLFGVLAFSSLSTQHVVTVHAQVEACTLTVNEAGGGTVALGPPDWGSVSVGQDAYGPYATLENSQIRAEYRPFHEGHDQFAIRKLYATNAGNQDQVGSQYLDADAGRGALMDASIEYDGPDRKTIHLEWHDKDNDLDEKITHRVSIFPDSTFIKIDYLDVQQGMNIVDLGWPGGTSTGTHVAYGGDSWIRDYVTLEYTPTLGSYYNRYPGDGVDDPVGGGSLNYNGHFITGVYNPSNDVGFARVMPVADIDILKLLLSDEERRGFELYPHPFFQPHAPFSGYLYTVTGGEAEVLSVGQQLADGNYGQFDYGCGDDVELMAVPDPGRVFSDWSGDLSGSANPTRLTIDGNQLVTATFTTAPPVIDVWHDSNQLFGHLGNAQRWVNILGNVSDPYYGVPSLTYALNGVPGPEVDGVPGGLMIGPHPSPSSRRRLFFDGDFNIDIDRNDLNEGLNTVVITATNGAGIQSTETVTVEYHGTNTWPLSYFVDWSSGITDVQEVAQIVDGQWTWDESGIRTAHVGYDRIIAIGDVTWGDYLVIVPITIHQVDTSAYTMTASAGPGLGISLHWNGHTDSPPLDPPCLQPKCGWLPVGSSNWYEWKQYGDNLLHLFVGDDDVNEPRLLETGETYWFKAAAQALAPTSTRYSFKVWPYGETEPPGWDLQWQTDADSSPTGSLLLVAHHIDATFGDVTILSSDDMTSTLTVNTAGNGSVDVTPYQSEYPYGQVVTLTATADPGWLFAGWSGDLSGSKNPQTSTITSDKEITATFTEMVSYTLAVTKVGSGAVAVNPGQPEYLTGTMVTLTATTTSPDWVFTGWDGDLTGHTNPASLTMNSNKAITASFANFDSVIASDDFDTCSLNTDLWTFIDPLEDATLTMTGTHATISVPVGPNHDIWGTGPGDFVNNAARIMQSALDTDFEIEVKFDSGVSEQYQTQGVLIEQDSNDLLRLEFLSDGSATKVFAAKIENGAATPIPTPDSWGQIIADTNVAPLYMRLKRMGDEWTQSYSFDGTNWETYVLSYTHSMTVTAVGVYGGNASTAPNDAPAHTAIIDYFYNTASPGPGDIDENTLTVNIDGSGNVAKNPDRTSYACGEEVELTATPAPDWVFIDWSGDLVATANPVTVTMDASKIITATFTEAEYHPVLNITKSGPTAAQVGDLVFYNFTVRHDATSDGSPVSNVSVTDDVAGAAIYLSGDDTDGLLEAGETWGYAVGYTIQPTDPDPLVNTVTVEGRDEQSAIVRDTDSHSLNVEYNPVLDIVKDGSVKVSVGDAAVYTFTVSHDTASDGSPVSSVFVTDDVAGVATYVSGDDNDGLLEAGESWVFIASYTVQSSDPDPLVNTATAQGQDGDGDPVNDTDSHSLDVDYVPVLQITKVGPATAELGDSVTYTFRVRHAVASDGSPVTNVSVDDDIAGPATYVTGDDGDDALEVNETWIFTASYTIQPTDPDPLVNTATTQGQDKDGDDVSDSDSHSLDVDYVPVLEIVKNGPTAAQVGDIVSYNFTVSHDAASDGSPVFSPSVTDDIAGDATYLSGDDDEDGGLEVGETWTFTATYTVQPTDPDPLVNTATAQGLDKDGDDVSDSSSHSLNVEYNPVLDIVKDGPDSASMGEKVNYTFNVSHDAASDGSPVSNVSVTDDIAGVATYVSGDDNDGLLEASESWVFTASYTVQSSDTDSLVNKATAQGQDGDGDPVSATDSHEMEVIPKWFIYLPIVLNRY